MKHRRERFRLENPDSPNKRDPGPARGLLRHLPAPGRFHHARIAPDPDLGDLVQHYWIVRWDLGDLPAQTRQVLPHPNVHLAIQAGHSLVHGIHTGLFQRTLSGRDGVFGIKFRAGAFRAVLGAAVSTLRNRSIPACEVFGPACANFERALLPHEHEGDDDAMVAIANRQLRAWQPVLTADALLAGRIVDEIAAEHGLTRSEQVQQRHGLHARRLQRLFHEQVGVGVKWVINRFRMHEALARLETGRAIDWVDLALQLGYFDQAHFIRDFKAMTGQTPARYLRGS